MKSYWIDSVKEKDKYPKLENDLDVDVCIIGGGLTGITTAYYLSKYNLKTVVIEKDRIGESTSGNSTAKITSQHGLIYKYLSDSKGKDFASKYFEANEKAIENIEKIVRREKIDCDFEYQSAYVFTQKIQDVEKIKDEVKAVNEIGGNATFLEGKDIEINKLNIVNNVDNSTEKLKINGDNIEDNIENDTNKNIDEKDLVKNEIQQITPIKAIAGIKFEKQAQFNPFKYLISLGKICTENGIEIYENTRTVDIEREENEEGNDRYNIFTKDGFKIKAKKLVVATKYPIINIPGFYFMKIYQSTSYAIGVETDKKLFDGMYISSEDPKISLRTAKYGDKYLLILAGFDNRTGDEIDLSLKYRYLEELSRKIYPKGKIKYHWNTEDCITLDKIPYIGDYSNLWNNAYVATGFNKWGITSSNIAANIITDKILGNKNKYEDIFVSTRVEPVKNIKEITNMVKESINSLVIKKIMITKEEINQIQKEEGKIVEIDGQKVGVYKDKNNEIYSINPVCKHLGCELVWNNLDKTWDCPCHGSRYDYTGKIIYGPSIKDLE